MVRSAFCEITSSITNRIRNLAHEFAKVPKFNMFSIGGGLRLVGPAPTRAGVPIPQFKSKVLDSVANCGGSELMLREITECTSHFGFLHAHLEQKRIKDGRS